MLFSSYVCMSVKAVLNVTRERLVEVESHLELLNLIENSKLIFREKS